jgi:hypothetical protein
VRKAGYKKEDVKMNFFKIIAERFENAMVAVTFAEAGEFETARKSMQKEVSKANALKAINRAPFVTDKNI